jgi:hypothetical protein
MTRAMAPDSACPGIRHNPRARAGVSRAPFPGGHPSEWSLPARSAPAADGRRRRFVAQRQSCLPRHSAATAAATAGLIAPNFRPRREVKDFADRRHRGGCDLNQVLTCRAGNLASVLGLHDAQIFSVFRKQSHRAGCDLLVAAGVRRSMRGTAGMIVRGRHGKMDLDFRNAA